MLDGRNSSLARSISDNGEWITGDSSISFGHAFSYYNGEMTDLGTFSGPRAGHSSANAVNNSGLVVGTAVDSGFYAFLYSGGPILSSAWGQAYTADNDSVASVRLPSVLDGICAGRDLCWHEICDPTE